MPLNSFNPVGAYQGARQNALTIQGQEQGIAREAASAPIRNQLANLNLDQAKVGAERGQTEFDQGQALKKAKIMNQAATAMKGIAPENRAIAFSSLMPKLQEFGIDTSQIQDQPLTDENLDLAILNTQSFLDNPIESIKKFGRVVEGERDGKKIFFQAGTEEGQGPRIIEDLTPPKSTAQQSFELKKIEQEEKKLASAEAKKQQAGIVSLDIDRALSQSLGAFTTGFTGSIASAVPGTDAFDLKNTLNGIKANVGFGKLQEMRENSPTGGALGSVSENENRLLQSVLGSVEQSQSQEQLTRNLDRLKVIFDAVVHGTAALPFTEAQFNALPVGTRYIDPDDGQLHEKR